MIPSQIYRGERVNYTSVLLYNVENNYVLLSVFVRI